MSQTNPTLGDIEQDCILMLREFDGDAAADDPISLRRDILRAADELARKSDCFWYAQSLPVSDGQVHYCAPGVYKLRCVNYATGPAGQAPQHYPLRPVRPEDMENVGGFGASWRDADGDERPRVAVIEGMNQIRLWRPPLVPTGTASAVEVEGYHTPSRALKADGVTPLFGASPADPWPLPVMAVDAVPFRVAMYRAFQFAGDAAKAARLQTAQAEYARVLGDLAAFAMNYRPVTRFSDRAGGYRWSG